MKKTILILTAMTMATVMGFASDKPVDVRGHLDRAERLEAKAATHEANAAELKKDKGYNPMRHKWPAMVAAPAEREARLAVKARKEAREAREMAAKLTKEPATVRSAE